MSKSGEISEASGVYRSECGEKGLGFEPSWETYEC
jgi:hypothetical protein